MTPTVDTVKRWRSRHPTYMRDWMRRHRANPAKGRIWGAEYVPARTPLALVLRLGLSCDTCGIKRPDRLFVCRIGGCSLKAEARQ